MTDVMGGDVAVHPFVVVKLKFVAGIQYLAWTHIGQILPASAAICDIGIGGVRSTARSSRCASLSTPVIVQAVCLQNNVANRVGMVWLPGRVGRIVDAVKAQPHADLALGDAQLGIGI